MKNFQNFESWMGYDKGSPIPYSNREWDNNEVPIAPLAVPLSKY